MAQKVARYVDPTLQAIKRLGGSARPAEVYKEVAHAMGLTDSPELQETLKSGGSRFENRIQFVRLYLALAGYIDRSKLGVWSLTEKGWSSGHLTESEVHQLLLDIQRQGNRSRAALAAQTDAGEEDETDDETDEPPTDYRTQLLAILRGLPPTGFEHVCQRLLRESGFQEVTVTGRAGDGGIDGEGVLKVNPFVSFKVLFQCKRYVGAVGSVEVRNFRGAMQGRADKGIILTTGTFTTEATREAVRDGAPPIELVDHKRVIELFESLELGLTPRTTYDVDLHFFSQFQTPS